jgi:G3E family GTPase
MRTIVDILTGFLGSGKTTLLNRLLADGAFADTAVVVNELGEIGLDHLLVSERTENVALLKGGCLCCAVVDSLPETLLDLCRGRSSGELPPFGRIVIETTGLADPGPIQRVVKTSPLLSHFLQAGVVVTTIEPHDMAKRLDRHPEARRQLAQADRIVLTKTDVDGAFSEEAMALLHGANPLAEIVTAAEIARDPARLVRPALSPAPDRMESGPAAHTHAVHAYSLPVEGEVTRAGIAALATVLERKVGDRLLRCKGIVQGANGAFLVQGVGSRLSSEPLASVPDGLRPHLTFIAEDCRREDFASRLHWLFVPAGSQPPAPEEME